MDDDFEDWTVPFRYFKKDKFYTFTLQAGPDITGPVRREHSRMLVSGEPLFIAVGHTSQQAPEVAMYIPWRAILHYEEF